jgi:hypothetical protein
MRLGIDFDGDFDFVPFAAYLEFGMVPKFPLDTDVHAAVTQVQADPDKVEAHWQLEAIRERRKRPGCKFDTATLKTINKRVAARLYERCRETA